MLRPKHMRVADRVAHLATAWDIKKRISTFCTVTYPAPYAEPVWTVERFVEHPEPSMVLQYGRRIALARTLNRLKGDKAPEDCHLIIRTVWGGARGYVGAPKRRREELGIDIKKLEVDVLEEDWLYSGLSRFKLDRLCFEYAQQALTNPRVQKYKVGEIDEARHIIPQN